MTRNIDRERQRAQEDADRMGCEVAIVVRPGQPTYWTPSDQLEAEEEPYVVARVRPRPAGERPAIPKENPVLRPHEKSGWKLARLLRVRLEPGREEN